MRLDNNREFKKDFICPSPNPVDQFETSIYYVKTHSAKCVICTTDNTKRFDMCK